MAKPFSKKLWATSALLPAMALGLLALSPLALSQEATVNMGSTVTGNQEQPRVLYIVPWKAPSGPDNLYQSLNSQLDVVFGHVERVELKRELRYRETLSQQEKPSG